MQRLLDTGMLTDFEQSFVPFLPKDFELPASWLKDFIEENFEIENKEFLTKHINFLIHHKMYGSYIQQCLFRLYLLESSNEKKYLIQQIANFIYQRPWLVATQLLRLLARPYFSDQLIHQSFLLRESMIDKLAFSYCGQNLHQYIRFFDQAYKLNFGLMPLVNDKYLMMAQGELPDKKIQELVSHEMGIYNQPINTLFLLLEMEPNLEQTKSLFQKIVNNVGSEFIILAIYKIINFIPLNHIETSFISSQIVLRKHVANLIRLIIHTNQLSVQENFLKFFWDTPCYKQSIFDYLSVNQTSIFLRWLLENKMIDKNFTIGESSLISWAIHNADSNLFFSIVEPFEKFSDNNKISALFSGNLDICQFIFNKLTVSKLQYFLSQAIKSNHIQIVQWFFQQGARPTIKADALYALAKNKNFLIIEELLKQGISIQPFMILRLIEAHDHELLGYLLSQHAGLVLGLDFNGQDLASYLIQQKNVEFLELLLQHHIDIELKSSHNLWQLCELAIIKNCPLFAKKLLALQNPSESLFELAKQYHQIDLLKFMLNEHNLAQLVKDQLEFLNWVASYGHYQVLELILKKNPELLQASSISLVLASRKGRVNSVKRLINYGADVNFADETGETALTWASYEGFARVVKYLLEDKLIDINHQNQNGLSALNNSILQGRCKIANILLKYGASFDDNEYNQLLNLACIKNNIRLLHTLMDLKKDDFSFTAEHIWLAITANAKDILEILLSKNKDMSLISVLIYAIDIGKLGVVKLLKSNGVNLNQIFPDGKTPLILALESQQLKIVDFILDSDVDVDIKWQGKTALDIAMDNNNSLAVLKIITKTTQSIVYWGGFIKKIASFSNRFQIYHESLKKGLYLHEIPKHDLSSLLEIIIQKDDAMTLSLFLEDQEFILPALAFSARYQSKHCFKKLCSKFKKIPDWIDFNNCSPLIWAIRNQNPEMVSHLTPQFNCPYLGNFAIDLATYLKNFEILKIIYEKQRDNFTNLKLQQITLGLLRAAQGKNLSQDDKKLLKRLLANIPLITDVWGNSALDYCEELDIQVQVLQQAKDLSIFKPERLEVCFKRIQKNEKKYLTIMKKMVLHQPNLLMLLDNPLLTERLFDKKTFAQIQILLVQLDPNINLDFQNKQQLIQVIQKIRDVKHQFKIGVGDLIDLNLFKKELSIFIKLKKLDEFISSVLSVLSQQGLFTNLFFGVSAQIKKIKSIYNNLSPEERLAYFEETSWIEDANNPLLQALGFEKKQQPKTIRDFKQLIHSMRTKK